MSKPLIECVLTNMKPKAFYRARDIADEMQADPSQVSKALRELSLGGVVECIKDGVRAIYITNQQSLF